MSNDITLYILSNLSYHIIVLRQSIRK